MSTADEDTHEEVAAVTTLLYSTNDDGPGPILEDPDARHAVIHGAYGMAPIAARPTAKTDALTKWEHVTLTWVQAVPFQVSLQFVDPTTGHVRVWTIARHLLSGGTAGEPTGDVAVSQIGEHVWVQLSTPAGRGSFAMDEGWLNEFLDATNDVVPPEHEFDALHIPDSPGQAHGGKGDSPC